MPVKTKVLLAYSACVMAATMFPGSNVNQFVSGWDKAVHGVMFMVFGILSSWVAPKKHVMVITGSLIFALLTELVQLMVPRRTFDLLDLLADGTGVLLGWSVYQWLSRKRRTTG